MGSHQEDACLGHLESAQRAGPAGPLQGGAGFASQYLADHGQAPLMGGFAQDLPLQLQLRWGFPLSRADPAVDWGFVLSALGRFPKTLM